MLAGTYSSDNKEQRSAQWGGPDVKQVIIYVTAVLGMLGALAALVVSFKSEYIRAWVVVIIIAVLVAGVSSLIWVARSQWNNHKLIAAAALIFTGLILASPLVILALALNRNTPNAASEISPSTSTSTPSASPASHNATPSVPSDLGESCSRLKAEAANESVGLTKLRDSIHAKDDKIVRYERPKYDAAHDAVLSAVASSANALGAYDRTGGKLHTDLQRKFRDDLDVLPNDLDKLQQNLPDKNQDAYEAWNQLVDYRTDSNAIAKIPC
jgi:hypothetical protein